MVKGEAVLTTNDAFFLLLILLKWGIQFRSGLIAEFVVPLLWQKNAQIKILLS